MSTFGGGYAIKAGATSGYTLGVKECAFCTYVGQVSGSFYSAYPAYFGPGQVIPATLAAGVNFSYGVIFTN